MSESVKAVCGLVLILGVFTAVLVWSVDRPDATTWSLRIGSIIAVVLALSVFLALHFRSDVAPDLLRQLANNYFNRDGFCFAFVGGQIDGVACIDAYFQNQFDKRCLGRIALRPAKGFFLNRAKIETLVFEIECAPAAFGFVRLPVAIPKANQGKRQSFEVGASAFYPEGKGQRVRFFDGIFLRTNTDFGRPFETAVVVAAAVTWSFVISRPATVSINLPEDVAEVVPAGVSPSLTTLWQLGDTYSRSDRKS